QEDLMRGMRGIGLVLVDERRDQVGAFMKVVGGAEDAVGARQVGGPSHDHKVVRAALNIERVVRLQRDEYGTAAALLDEIEAVVEELAEQRHPGVERRGKACVRRNVVNEEVFVVADGGIGIVLGLVAGAELLIGSLGRLDRGGVIGALIG